MIPSPLPVDPIFLRSHVLAHAGPEALLAHIVAAVDALASHGVEIVPTVHLALDELTEAVIEHAARRDPAAFDRMRIAIEAELAGTAVAARAHAVLATVPRRPSWA